MQQEITAAGPSAPIRILGLNAAGEESGNATVCEGRTLPWLQDTAEQQVWTRWEVVYRDVVILDEENQRLAVFNLTEHNLGEPANYDSLKALLLDLAR